MGTFSAAHWAIALVLLAGLGYFAYLVCSLLWAGAKATGARWKLGVIALLVPLAVLAIIGIIGAGGLQADISQDEWERGVLSMPKR